MKATQSKIKKAISARSGEARRMVSASASDRHGDSELAIRIQEPANLEYEFAKLAETATPVHSLFVRGHFPVPQIDPAQWRLQVEGAVDKALSLSLEDIEAMPSVTHTSVLECAGNGRMFLPNVPEGVQWGLGAVGSVTWTGVLLRDVLQLAGIQSGVAEIVFEGADKGTPEQHLKPKDEIHFARSLPISVATRPEVLLAYKMNGSPLPAEHGAPLRIVVPGWYGVAAVKWLTRIDAVRVPFQGYFQTVEYAYWKDDGVHPPERLPVAEILLKSQISRPSMHDRIPVGESYQVSGAAWTAKEKIKGVEVSTDGGKNWKATKLRGKPSGHAWQLWDWKWTPRSPGEYVLMSRATDSRGAIQPAEHDENHESYLIHHTLPITVEVV